MIFKTASGSTYEVDHKQKRCRRIEGVRPGTKRLGTDGEWRNFESISPVEPGSCVVINWGDWVKPLYDGTVPFAKVTITSPVVR